VDFDLQLSPGQRRLLGIYRRRGATPMVLMITGASLLLSVVATAAAMAVQRPPLVDWIISMTMATVIPLIVAPIASTLTVRLLGTIVVAHDHLDVLASTDALTGLANRRRFFTVAEQLAATCPAGEVVLVAVTDMDGFKTVNDTHGHAMGDAALCRLADLLTGAVDGVGSAARMGGDEFACVVRVRDDRVEDIQRRIREACSDIRFGEELRLSASAGFSSVDAPTEIDAALARADVALYLSKSRLKRRRSDREPLQSPRAA
jgi:diguanylate cyclase (GGDEF)-like protein